MSAQSISLGLPIKKLPPLRKQFQGLPRPYQVMISRYSYVNGTAGLSENDSRTDGVGPEAGKY